jgi:hypothetical protein
MRVILLWRALNEKLKNFAQQELDGPWSLAVSALVSFTNSMVSGCCVA